MGYLEGVLEGVILGVIIVGVCKITSCCSEWVSSICYRVKHWASVGLVVENY